MNEPKHNNNAHNNTEHNNNGHKSAEDALRRRLETSPFWNHLGIQLVSMETGRAELKLPVKSELGQSFALVHGGAIASLLDAAGAVAHFAAMDLSREYLSTIELKINYLNPVQVTAAEMLATGKVLKKGKKIGVSSIEIKLAGGEELVAAGMATYAILEHKNKKTKPEQEG